MFCFRQSHLSHCSYLNFLKAIAVSVVVIVLPSITFACFIHLSDWDSVMAVPSDFVSPYLANAPNCCRSTDGPRRGSPFSDPPGVTGVTGWSPEAVDGADAGVLSDVAELSAGLLFCRAGVSGAEVSASPLSDILRGTDGEKLKAPEVKESPMDGPFGRNKYSF